MAVYFVWSAVAALLALPLEVAVELNVDRVPGVRVRVKLAGIVIYYNASVARRDGDYVFDIRRENSGRNHSRTLRQLRQGGLPLRLLLPAFKAGAALIMRNVVTHSVAVRMRLGTGDAALSALLCGVAGILTAALCAVADVLPEIEVQPDYARTTFIMRAEGMFSLRTGHIIGAGLAAIGEYCKGALKEWRTRQTATR